MQTPLNTQNENLFTFRYDELHIEVMGGVRTDRLDSLRVTLRIKAGFDTARNNLDLYNDNQVQQFARRCAAKLQLGTRSVLDALEALTEQLESYILAKQNEEQEDKKSYEQTPEEIREAKTFLSSPNLMQRTDENIQKSGIIGEDNNRQIMYIILTSRLMASPLNCISMGSSGVGKSHLQESIAKLFPPEEIIEITELTKNSLYYHGQYELCHKILLIEDLTGARNALYPVRELQTKKRISKKVVVHLRNGKAKTELRTVEGPVCVAACTTWASVYEDNANRSFLLDIDETPEQDQRIMNHQRNLSAGQINTEQQQKTRKLMQNVQRILHPVKVINPYAPHLNFPSNIFKPRRTNAHYLHFIEAVTFFHQYQRTPKIDQETGEQYIETTIEDIQIANELLKNILLRKADELTSRCRNFFEQLKEHLIQNNLQAYTTPYIRKTLRIPSSSSSSIGRYQEELLQLGLIKISKGTQNKGYEYQITDTQEYEQLQKSVLTVLDRTLLNIQSIEQQKNESSAVVKTQGLASPKALASRKK
jgi:hypothetical protein